MDDTDAGEAAEPGCAQSPTTLSPPTPSTISPPAHIRPVLQMNLNVSPVTRAIALANGDLSHLKLQSALLQYTEILTNSPGHPVAFVNRCLCYLLLDYPHLAVWDAQRAILALNHARCPKSDALDIRSKLYNVYLYVLQSTSNEAPWKTGRASYPGRGSFEFLDVGLASICIRPTVRGELHSGHTAIDSVKEHLLRDIHAKAYYRLAVSLWKCRGGAWQSALDQICVAQQSCHLTAEDLEQFSSLQNQILGQIECVMNTESNIRTHLRETLRWSAPNLQRHEDAGVRRLLRTRFTKIEKELYPWDTDSVSSKTNPREAARVMTSVLAWPLAQCHFIVFKTDATCKVASLMLQASKPIERGEIIFKEKSAYHAVAAADSSINCDTCGLLLHASGELRRKAVDDAKAWIKSQTETRRRSNLGRSIKDFMKSPDAADACAANQARNTADKATMDIDVSASPSTDDTDPRLPTGFQICPFCRKAAFCSRTCASRALASGYYHSWLCEVPRRTVDCDAYSPNVWQIPTTSYTAILDEVSKRLLSESTRDRSVTANAFVKIMHGGLRAPRGMASDQDELRSEAMWLWNEENRPTLEERYSYCDLLERRIGKEESKDYHACQPEELNQGSSKHSPHSEEVDVSMTEDDMTTTNRAEPGSPDAKTRLYSPTHSFSPTTQCSDNPSSSTLSEDHQVESTAAYTSDDPHVNANNFIEPTTDWSFDSNVRLPLQSIYDMHAKVSRASGILHQMDIERYDGWMLETLRAKVDAHLRYHRYPTMSIKFDNHGNEVERMEIPQEGEADKHGDPVEERKSRGWVGELFPVCTTIRRADSRMAMTPNVELVYAEGKCKVVALDDIAPGELLLC